MWKIISRKNVLIEMLLFFIIQNQETALETPSARKNDVVVFTFSDQHWIFLHAHTIVYRKRERKQWTNFYSTGGFLSIFPF